MEDRDKDIVSFNQHKEDIRKAAEQAKTTIAEAAGLAAKAIADAAAISVKVLSIKNADDHDLLIELKTRMEGLKDDIKSLRDNVSVRLEDHEKRLTSIEKTKGAQTILITIGTSLMALLVMIMIYHILGK
jgi:phage host-nuclease inhibitor protein Gam